MRTAVIDVEQLPQPTTFLNFSGDQSRMVGRYLGPNTLGEYLTVVEAMWDGNAGFGHTRIGLAFGIYTIGGEPTDQEGFPTEVAQDQAVRRMQAAWGAFRTPGIVVPERAGKPKRLTPVLPVNDPNALIRVTGIE